MNYPLDIRFKTFSMTPQVKVSDATGQVLMYVKEKLALKAAVKFFSDENQQNQLYNVAADKIIGLTITYDITTPQGSRVGALRNPGMKSLWKATFPILDASGQEIGLIHEQNPWVKVLDALLSDVPFVGMYINPIYVVELRGNPLLLIRKQPSLTEGKFAVEKTAELTAADETLLLPAMVMFIMLERMRK